MPNWSGDSPRIIESIVAKTGLPVEEVTALVAACRDAVDELIADDFSIAAPPLLYATASDPVFAALSRRMKTCSDAEARGWPELEYEDLAAWLGVTPAQVARHPVATEDIVFARVLERLGLSVYDDPDTWPGDRLAEAERMQLVLGAWVDSFADRRPYLVGPVGYERDFENWLVENLDVLANLGFPVRLADRGRQRWLDGGRLKPDLLCRFTEDADGWARKGDWLVIENKAFPAYPEAGDQLAGYVAQVRAELAGSTERVFGLLAADGASARVQAHLDALSIEYVSLAALGYRRREWPH